MVNYTSFSNGTYENETVLMKCITHSSDMPKYKWYRDSVQLMEHADSLFIQNINRKESGNYFCHVFTDFANEISNNVTVQVTCMFITLYWKLVVLENLWNTQKNKSLNCIKSIRVLFRHFPLFEYWNGQSNSPYSVFNLNARNSVIYIGLMISCPGSGAKMATVQPSRR